MDLNSVRVFLLPLANKRLNVSLIRKNQWRQWSYRWYLYSLKLLGKCHIHIFRGQYAYAKDEGQRTLRGVVSDEGVKDKKNHLPS